VEETRYHLRERRFGSFSRTLSLPASINPDQIQASYEAGVLSLHLPKTAEAKPRRIEIQSSEQILTG
jgi:HSP20 family protein